jgi:hypothetical protein
MFSLSMTSTSHVTLRSSGFGTVCKCRMSGGDSPSRSSGAGVTVCDPVVGVSSRTRSMDFKCLMRDGVGVEFSVKIRESLRKFYHLQNFIT